MTQTQSLNAEQKKIQALWESLPETSRFDLSAALAVKASATKKTSTGTKHSIQLAVSENNAAKMREARVILEHLEMRTQIVERPCKQCGRQFATDYLFAAYCGDICLAASLREKYNFQWHPEKTPEERWGFEFEPPSIVTPETLEKLKGWARRILDLPTVESYRGLDVEQKVPVEWDNHEVIMKLPTPPKKNKFSGL